MRARRAAVLLVVVLVGVACTGDDLPSVGVETVGGGEVTQTVSAPASVEAASRQDVAAGISGVVVALEAEDGTRIRQGRPVLRLSSEQVDLAVEQAEAAEAAAAAVGGIGVDGSGDETLAATDRAVHRLDESTRPRLQEARRRAANIDDRDQRAAARATVAAIDASYRTTRAALLESGRALAASQDATAASLSRALNQAVASTTAAQQAQARAAATAARRQSDELVVNAPFTGTVQFGEAAASDGGELPAGIPPELAGAAGSLGALAGGGSGSGSGTLRVGAPVSAGQTLFTVYDLRDFYVSADVDEVDAPELEVGQRADVVIDAFPDATFEGVVERVDIAAATTEAGGVGYPVRIRLLLADDDPSPRVGMTAGVDIATKTESSDLVVPSRALLRGDGGSHVFVVRDERAVSVPVEVVALGEDRAAVAGDLEPDEPVVVTGYEDLADGDRVAVE